MAGPKEGYVLAELVSLEPVLWYRKAYLIVHHYAQYVWQSTDFEDIVAR